MNPDEYTQAFMYEIFVRRAHNMPDRSSRNGADSGVFACLIIFDNEGKQAKYDKQLTKTKNYLNKAINKFIARKPKLKPDEIAALEGLLVRLERSSTVAELTGIINEALDITHPYK